jgi:hypothetical protein
LHELAHWTGAKHRLNRLTDNQPFGSPEYAEEEIRADLSSLYLAAELGIPYDPKDQASYIHHWIQVLKNDKNEVFRAAAGMPQRLATTCTHRRTAKSKRQSPDRSPNASALRLSSDRSVLAELWVRRLILEARTLQQLRAEVVKHPQQLILEWDSGAAFHKGHL